MSTTIALLAPRLPVLAGVANVKTAELPAASLMVPPFGRVNDVVAV